MPRKESMNELEVLMKSRPDEATGKGQMSQNLLICSWPEQPRCTVAVHSYGRASWAGRKTAPFPAAWSVWTRRAGGRVGQTAARLCNSTSTFNLFI